MLPSHSCLRGGRLLGCELQLSVIAWTGFNTLRKNILLLVSVCAAEEANIDRTLKWHNHELGLSVPSPGAPQAVTVQTRAILQEKKTKPHTSDNKSHGTSTALLGKSNRKSSEDPWAQLGAGHRVLQFPWHFWVPGNNGLSFYLQLPFFPDDYYSSAAEWMPPRRGSFN